MIEFRSWCQYCNKSHADSLVTGHALLYVSGLPNFNFDNNKESELTQQGDKVS